MSSFEIPHNGDFYGQYASDRVLLGKEDGLEETGADIRGDGTIGFHKTGMFDELPTLPDEATGNIKKELPDYIAVEGMSVVPEVLAIEGFKGRDEAKDLADQWMKQNGYTWDQE